MKYYQSPVNGQELVGWFQWLWMETFLCGQSLSFPNAVDYSYTDLRSYFLHSDFCALHILMAKFPLVGTIWSEDANNKFSELVMESSCFIEVIGTIKTHTKLVNMGIKGSSLGAQLVQGIHPQLDQILFYYTDSTVYIYIYIL